MAMPELTAAHKDLRSRAHRSLLETVRKFQEFKEAMESEPAVNTYSVDTVLGRMEYADDVTNQLEYLWNLLDDFKDEFEAILDLET